ncbi:MAG TPA: ribonuclease H [Microthrixaceae bacterium]|nr:ribonuclease H [Microthrixaceae bacterium]
MSTTNSVRVYTDGACRGNPGPGGWAWAVGGGPWASGHDPDTTNQRMEVRAVLEAARQLEGPLVVVSDSTYVVHCWRDAWWKGWLAKGWKNSQRKPVANQDLWEQLVPVFRDRPDFSMEWVKGHSGDPMNDLVDRLAVAASHGRPGSGDGRPPSDLLDDADQVRRGSVAGAGAPDSSASSRSGSAAPPSARDGRVPTGWRLVVTGLRDTALARGGDAGVLERRLAEILSAQQQLHPDLVVLSGLRPGSEELGARAAAVADVPFVAVLPYPDPMAGRPESDQAAFARLVTSADSSVTLERQRPTDLDGRRKSLQRRDGWMRSVADAAIVLTDGQDPDAELALQRYTDAVGDEVWEFNL